jgi:hypothetical protein
MGRAPGARFEVHAMNPNHAKLGIGLSLAVAAIAATSGDADAAGVRRRHRFRSAPAPARGKTPALDANGAADTSSKAPVAGAAVQGGFRQDVVSGGALLAMSPNRALVLNSYRGLSLVDTSDAAAPRVLASVAMDGTAERMFLGSDEVAVVSDVYGADGASTVVTSVVIGESSLTVAGGVQTAGALRDAARSGDDLVLVVGAGYYGPMMMNADGTSGGGALNTPNGPTKSATSGAYFPWYGGSAHVARVRIGADGAPTLLGAAEVVGDVIADALTGTEAVLAVQSSWYAQTNYLLPPGGDPSGKYPSTGDGGWTYPTITLVRFADGGSGAPTAGGSLELKGVSGVAALDRDGAVLRALEYGDTGEIVATYDLSGGAPTALDSLALGDWPSAWAFAGGAFVYGSTAWSWDIGVPTDPVFDPNGVKQTFDAAGAGVSAGTGAASGPTSALHSVDLRDPSHLAAGSSIDLGAGWLSTLLPVDGGLVGSLNGYDGGAGSTSVFRVDLSDPAVPSLVGTLTIDGYANVGPVVGDVLLVNGGATNETGSFVASTRLVELSGGGLALGGSFAAPSWTAAAARDANLLGLASYDRLTLVDLADQANPVVAGEVRFVVNVAGFAALSANAGVVLATDYVGGGVEVRSVALPAADALNPLSTVKVATGDAQMFSAPPFVYVVATDWSTGRASLTVVDATDPAHLAARGSLDLASYPGQVFLKDGALLLLRTADSLFVDAQDKRGRTIKKAAKDAFGRAPKSWLRSTTGAVLDVVDLADPDAPRAARRRVLAWDESGAAVLSGDSLFVPTYVNLTLPGGDASYGYMIAEIDLTNSLRPSAGLPVDVPGQLVAAAGSPHQVLTADYGYDPATGTSTSSLHVVDLSLGFGRRVLATAVLAGYPEAVAVGGGRAYVTIETWGDVATQNAGPVAIKSASAQLLTLDVADLSTSSTVERSGGAYAGQIAGGCLFLRTWGWTGALDVYSLADPSTPAFVASQSVAGNAGDIVVVGGRAYAPGGMYGVQSFDLSK